VAGIKTASIGVDQTSFPVGFGGAIKLQAAFRKESRTSLRSVSAARSDPGEPLSAIPLFSAVRTQSILLREL
jgi:hypothetical protein